MADKEIIIDGVDISECNYAILPKKQCPMKSMPYVKETSCIACKEHNTKLNFCKNNPNCYYKQLKHQEQKNENLNEVTIEQRKENTELTIKLGEMINRGGELCEELQKYKQTIDEIEKYLDAQQKYFDGEDYHNLLAIINKVKE